MATLKIGDKVDGKVSRIITRIGVVFEISGAREALMPREHYGKKLPRLRLGDEVANLHILDVDPEAQGCAQIILSGEVPPKAEVPQAQQTSTSARSTPIKERPKSSAKLPHKSTVRKTSPRIADRVNGRVVKVINRVGIVFDIGVHCEAMMLHEDFGKKLPKLRPGDQVADLIVLEVDDEQEDAGRQILLSGEAMVKLTPNSEKLLPKKLPSPSRSPVLSPPATPPDLESPSPQEVEAPDSDWSDSICELSVLADENAVSALHSLQEAEVSESDWSDDSICELSAAVLMPSMHSMKARIAGSMRKGVNVHSSNGTPSTSSTGSHGIVDRRVSESRPKDIHVHSTLYESAPAVAFSPPPQPQPVTPASQSCVGQECRIRRRARAVPFSRLPPETFSESTHVASVSSGNSRKSCGHSDKNCRKGIFDSRTIGNYVDAAEQGQPVGFVPPPRGSGDCADALQQDRLDLLMRAPRCTGGGYADPVEDGPRGRQKQHRVWHAHRGQPRSASRGRSRSASPSRATVMNGSSKVADERAIQALMSSILNTAQEMGVSCDQLSPVLSSLHHLNGNLRVNDNLQAPRKNDAGLHHRKAQPQTDIVCWKPQANGNDWSQQASDSELCEGPGSPPPRDMVSQFPSDSRRVSQKHRLRHARRSPATEPSAAGGPNGKPLELPAGPARHHDRHLLAQLQTELASLQGRCLPRQAQLSSEDEAWDAEAIGNRHTSRRAIGPKHLRSYPRDLAESDGMVRPPRRALESLVVGEQVWGTVVSVLPSLGIWFDIGVEKDAMLPKRHFGFSNKMFEVGDVVCGLVVVCLDLVKNQITLSAEGLKFGKSKSISRPGVNV
mmetsp:Transcript_117029/g.212938  ORF Transcript_117029/g.212938 Transcript_117029/m.212938 type:complete len:840 (+) Transcript_117029:84-2603(+)